MTFDPNTIEPSAKLELYLKVLEFGPQGSGKTWNALKMMAGIGKGKVLLLDNDGGARHLSRQDGFDFDFKAVKNIQDVIEAFEWLINPKTDHPYTCVVVESMTLMNKEAVDETLGRKARKAHKPIEEVEMEGKDWGNAKRNLERFSRLLQSIPINVILTAREKTESSWGKSKGEILHQVPDCEKGLPYAVDIVMRLLGQDKEGRFMASTTEHGCKDRTGMLPSGLFELTDNLFTDEQIGRKAGTIEMITDEQMGVLSLLFIDTPRERVAKMFDHYGVIVSDELTEAQAAEAIATLQLDAPEQEREAA